MDSRGFTLIELIVVIACIAIMAAIAYPAFSDWMRNAEVRTVAREIASTLRDARTRAITENLEHEVSFDLNADSYFLRRGDRPYHTPSFGSCPGCWTVIKDYGDLPAGIDIRGTLNCSNTSDSNFSFQFNPNGTGTNTYVCVLDHAGEKKYRVEVPHASTGRVIVTKWDAGTNTWK